MYLCIVKPKYSKMENLFTKAVHESQSTLVEVVKKRNEKSTARRKSIEQERIDHENWLERKRMENKNKPLDFKKKERIKDMLKILNGLPPYNEGGNVCYGDGYYYKSIGAKEGNKEYDTAMEELIEEFGSISTWGRFMDKIWKYERYDRNKK